MLTIVKRVVGALLALLGLALTVVGVWFAAQLGSSGTAEFTARPDTRDPLVIRPDVLNRLEVDATVTARSADGGTVWMALANPSDATAVLGSARHVDVTGVSVREGTLQTAVRGSGAAAELGAADLWRQQDEGSGSATLTVDQSQAPETLVVTSQGAPLRSVTFTVADKTWFVEAVVGALVGLFLLVVGALLLWPRRHHDAHPDARGASDAASGTPEGSTPVGTPTTDAPPTAEEPTTAEEPVTADEATAPADPGTPARDEEVTR